MKIDNEVEILLEKLNKMGSFLKELEGTDFGLYIPIYAEGEEIKLMLEGYSQTERDLVVSISKESKPTPTDTKPVAWFGNLTGKDSSCIHGGIQNCKHCTSHTANCKHCSKHTTDRPGSNFDAPELNYDAAIEQLINYRDLLGRLAIEGFGIALLHGHSDKYMFTRLPDGYVSVVSEGATSFRKVEEVNLDNSFVPNMWRTKNGKIEVAAGYSIKFSQP